jgi:hypothetical protein
MENEPTLVRSNGSASAPSWKSCHRSSAWNASAPTGLIPLWRTIKHDEVYLRAYESVSQARASLARFSKSR